MKKRLISMLMAVLMIASLLPAAALAGDDTSDTHEHKYTTVSIKKDAEKKTPGVEYKVCKECGKIDTKSISIKAFALLWNQCRKCETGKTMIVKAASCRNEGLTISYCEKCGKAFTNKDFGNSTYKIEKALEHVYGDFHIEKAPTCTKSGTGYAVCKLCGDAAYFEGEKAATELLKLSDFDGNATAYANRVRAVYEMFEPTNPKHSNTKLLVAVTKETTAKDINGNEITLYPAKKAQHVAAVGGKAYKLNPETGLYVTDTENSANFIEGYAGDMICPDCGVGFKTDKQPITHKFTVDTSDSKLATFDKTTLKGVDGKADVVKCDTCNYKGGETIRAMGMYDTWYGEDAVPDTCENAGVGATIYWRDKTTGDVKSKEGSEGKALGHNYVLVEGEKATCLHDGFEYVNYKKCTRCHAPDPTGDINKTITITAPGKHDYVLDSFYEATCQHQGLAYKSCKLCGEKMLNEKNGTLYVEVTPMVAHTASDKLANVKEATCTEVGYTGDKVCKFCGIVMEEGKEIPMVDHTPMDVEAKAPTCTEPGVTKGTVCKVCKKVLSAQETVPALGHKTELVNAKEATCLEAGYTGDKVCTVCKQTIEKGTEVKALGHNYVKGVCTRCDAKQPGYNPFTDVKKGPYYDAILWAYCNGVTNGISDTVFGVDNGCTRAQIVTFLYRAAGQPKVENVKNPFTDVSKNSTYYNAIMWAVENGITTGKTATTFDPNAVCTRGQIVTFLWRYEKAPIVSSLAKFDDVAAGSYCYNAVMWAVENGITNGKTTTTFAPNDTCTRAQAVTFIYREFAK